MSQQKIGNPAVVGLAGFGLTTMLLQFHNLHWVDTEIVLPMGFIFGGLAQMIAGFQEQKTGNNFGYSAFVSYGAFWIGLAMIWLMKITGLYTPSAAQVGWYLIPWTLYTGGMWLASWRIHTAMSLTFLTLFLGFIFLDIGHFGLPIFNTIAAVDLIICALLAWYMMFAAIINDLAGKTVLSCGKAWVK